jgi:hypothetical protein
LVVAEPAVKFATLCEDWPRLPAMLPELDEDEPEPEPAAVQDHDEFPDIFTEMAN